MSITTLARAKSHSSIYFDDKDDVLQLYLNAAEQYVAKFLNRETITEFAQDGVSPTELEPVIESLVLECFDDKWRNRGVFIDGADLTENQAWMRAAHLYRDGLGV